ncbi:hypothetical protein YUWDRAFT_03997 [Streptomyces sp. AmelKG-D3]|nr:hypothetical protein YUWDRAFT_03997 [Streptomyces sp. AmelKG-D3]
MCGFVREVDRFSDACPHRDADVGSGGAAGWTREREDLSVKFRADFMAELNEA